MRKSYSRSKSSHRFMGRNGASAGVLCRVALSDASVGSPNGFGSSGSLFLSSVDSAGIPVSIFSSSNANASARASSIRTRASY